METPLPEPKWTIDGVDHVSAADVPPPRTRESVAAWAASIGAHIVEWDPAAEHAPETGRATEAAKRLGLRRVVISATNGYAG